MADVAFGVLGVVPLVLLAHKSTVEKLKKFKRYDKEAELLQHAYEIQTQFFETEWRIIAELTLQEDYALWYMGTHKDLGQVSSSVTNLNARLEESLGTLYKPCLYILNNINKASQALKLGLDGIILPVRNQKETRQERVAACKTRIRDGLKMMNHGDGYKQLIKDFRVCNYDLQMLREKVDRLKGPETWRGNLRQPRSLKTSEYLRISSENSRMRNAANALHAGLVEAWRCSGVDHSKHVFKLFTETKATQHELLMNLAISFHRRPQSTTELSGVHLEVRSQDVTCQTNRPFTITDNHDETDLRCSQDTCAELTRAHTSVDSRASPLPSACLGHIEVSSEPKFRHNFYANPKQASWVLKSEAYPLTDIIEHASEEHITNLFQLQLARSVAMTMLKLYSTPWLNECWQLGDMAIFVDNSKGPGSTIDTLHVDDECASAFGSRLRGGCTPDTKAIKSRPLYSLGVALLQIDRWAVFDLNRIDEVRKEAWKPSPLKSRYWTLIQMCLDCKFGDENGTNLTASTLQKKVCEDVIGELDKLVKLAQSWELPMTRISSEDRTAE